MKGLLIMSFTMLAASMAPTGTTAMERKIVIDMHCHIAGIGAQGSGCFVSDRLRRSWKYRIYLKAFGVTEADLMKEGDAVVVQRLAETLAQSQAVTHAVVLALDGAVNENGELDREATEVYIPNEFVAAEVRKYPNLLYGASINPYRRDAIERLERAAQDGAVLIKWLPPIQHIDPADPRLTPFYIKLKELGLPLLSHTGIEGSFTRARHELGDPERLRLPLSLGVTVIAAHSACSGSSQGEANYDRFLRLCREYPNLYGDISSLTQLNRLGKLQQVLRQPELHGRIFYGSDMPLINTAIVTPFAFPFQVTLREMIRISGIKNPWDRDVALKKSLGLTDDILSAAAGRLQIKTSTQQSREAK